jgi:chromosome partitioning protein
MDEKRTHVIAIGNQKGGVGKTTNTLHLAVALGEMERRVLVVDLDMNNGSTTLFGVPPEVYAHASILQVITGDVDPDDAILAFDDKELDIELPKNVDLIPASRELEKVDMFLSKQDQFYSPRECLMEPIRKLRELSRYDYVILDTGPTATTPTKGAYMVADHFIISVIPERLAVEGLGKTLADIKAARQPNRNPSLHLLGIIVSGLDQRVRKARAYTEEIEQKFQTPGFSGKFETTIGRAAAIPNAQREFKTVIQAEPDHRIAKQFRALAREVEERILKREGQGAPVDTQRMTANA